MCLHAGMLIEQKDLISMANTHNRSERDILNRYEKQPLGKIFKIFGKYKFLMIFATVTFIMFNMIGLVMPWVLKITIDRVLPNADYLLFWFMCGALVIIYLVRFLLRYVATYLMDYAGIRLIVDVRQKVFKHLQSLSLRFYQEYRTGKLITNILTDVNHLNGLISGVLVNLVIHFFTIVCILVALFSMNPKLSLLSFVLMGLQFFNFTFFRRRIERQ